MNKILNKRKRTLFKDFTLVLFCGEHKIHIGIGLINDATMDLKIIELV